MNFKKMISIAMALLVILVAPIFSQQFGTCFGCSETGCIQCHVATRENYPIGEGWYICLGECTAGSYFANTGSEIILVTNVGEIVVWLFLMKRRQYDRLMRFEAQ